MRILYVAALLLILAACGASTVRQVTMDGRDSSGAVVSPINLWNNYRTRARVTGTAQHGEAVTLLQQDGAGCLVRTASGAEGWVTCANFIKEFKP